MSSRPNVESVFDRALIEHVDVIAEIRSERSLFVSIAGSMAAAIRSGGKILWCGNGGSAADCQHLAAELVGRFRRERKGLASIALTTDTSILTAIGNDYGYNSVFARQVEALGQPGDVIVGISTSGNSPNVLAALVSAKAMGLVTVAFTGAGGGELAGLADHLFAAKSPNTARVQEAHILLGHMLCDWIELDWIHSVEQHDELDTLVHGGAGND